MKITKVQLTVILEINNELDNLENVLSELDYDFSYKLSDELDLIVSQEITETEILESYNN